MRPEYIIREESKEDEDGPPLLKATVILLVTLDPTLRIYQSRSWWSSEKNATKEAAFEAYVSLYHAGLVNNHLLPLSFTETSKYMEKQDSITEVREQFKPWLGVARAWEREEQIQRRVLTLKDEAGLTKCQIEMFIPANLPNMKSILIYWDAANKLEIEIGLTTTIQHLVLIRDDTRALRSHSYGHRFQIEQLGHVAVFKATNTEISSMLERNMPLTPQDRMDESVGLLRDAQNHGYPYLFQSWLPTKPLQQFIQKPHKDHDTFAQDQPFVALKKWSIRSDFLHLVQGSEADMREIEYFTVLPQTRITLDPLPIAIFQFGLLIPSLLHKVQIQLVVAELCATVLSEVEILDLELVRTAISTPVAREQDNYQKLEFLGDSVLKFLVSIFAASKCKQSIVLYFAALA
jgi:dsRNA-specific ribonuclease